MKSLSPGMKRLRHSHKGWLCSTRGQEGSSEGQSGGTSLEEPKVRQQKMAVLPLSVWGWVQQTATGPGVKSHPEHMRNTKWRCREKRKPWETEVCGECMWWCELAMSKTLEPQAQGGMAKPSSEDWVECWQCVQTVSTVASPLWIFMTEPTETAPTDINKTCPLGLPISA